MTLPVFLGERLDPGEGHHQLTGAEARHALRVRRIRPGERIDIVDGAGVRLRGVVTATESEPDRLTIAVEHRLTEEPPRPPVFLVQALGKGGRDEAAIEAATELGVDGILAWQSERSVSRWHGAKIAKGVARWSALIQAAAKQSRRARFPQNLGFVAGAQAGPALAERIGGTAQVFILHESADQSLVRSQIDGGAPVVIVVGPEGGLTDAEIDHWRAHGGRPVQLGHHVLRTSTAGPAAVAVVNAQVGRW